MRLRGTCLAYPSAPGRIRPRRFVIAWERSWPARTSIRRRAISVRRRLQRRRRRRRRQTMRPKRKWPRCPVSQISTEDAYLIFNKWRDEQSALQLVMKRPPGLRAVNSAFIKSVLPHSHQVLIAALVDSEYVSVAVNLEGAEYEYEDASAVLPDFAGGKWVCFLAANFPNGNRYVFGERTAAKA